MTDAMTAGPSGHPGTDAPDAELALRAADGDRLAIEILWHRHRRWVASVLLAHKPRFVELEDLLQDVATTLVAKVDTIRDQAHVRAWLRVVAVNAARASARAGRRRRHHRRHQGLDELDDEGPAIEAACPVSAEETDSTLRSLERLPLDYREPLMMRAVSGLRSRQIAEILGISEATVDTRVARARRMLRELRQDPLGRTASTRDASTTTTD